MSECIKTDDKSVAILLAIYNPNIKWLKELLASINSQTYKNIILFAIDDCSPDVGFDDIKICFEECLADINWKLERNDNNIGSNAVFELLTQKAEADYFAYCDQDDIWNKYKIEKLVKLLENTKSVLVCSDMYVIDSNGKKISDSIRKIRKRQVFFRGENLYKVFVFRNFVTGCTMLINGSLAKSSIPFEGYMFHDHWLALYASLNGKIEYTYERLVKYRIHNKNQSGVLCGINSKDDYYKIRIVKMKTLYKNLRKRLGAYNDDLNNILKELVFWLNIRESYYKQPSFKKAFDLLKFKSFGISTLQLELVLPYLPESVFKFIVFLIRKGYL